jgi:hypothetical protein
MKKAIKILKRWHYTIGAILLVVGFILLRVFLYTQAKRILPEIQVVVPGVSEFYLPQPGKYTIFYEYESIIGEKIYSTGESLPEMVVRLQSKQDYRKIDLSKPSRAKKYKIRGRSGVSVLEFKAKDSGNYLLFTEYRYGAGHPELVFAISKFKRLRIILKGVGIYLATLIIAGILMLRSFSRGEASKQKVSN